MEDPLKRSFYMEMCKLEKWSPRQLKERIQSMLYERTAISSNLGKYERAERAPELTTVYIIASALDWEREDMFGD